MKDILQVTGEDGSVKAWPWHQVAKAHVSTGEMSLVDFVGGNSETLPTMAVADFLEIPVPHREAVAGIITVLGEPEPSPSAILEPAQPQQQPQPTQQALHRNTIAPRRR